MDLALEAILGVVFGLLAGLFIGRLSCKRHLSQTALRLRDLAKRYGCHAQSNLKDLHSISHYYLDELTRLLDRAQKNEKTCEAVCRLLYTLPKGVLVISETKKVIFLNQELLKMLGAPGTLEDWLGKDLIELIRFRSLIDAIEQAKKGKGHRSRVRIQYRGSVLDVHVVPVQQDPYDIFLYWEDVTTCVRVKESARELMANVAHELRTPLTSIKGYAETLLDSQVEDRELQTHFLQVILNNADRLSNLVKDVLLLSTLESTTHDQLGTERIDMVEITRQLVDFLSPVAEKRGVEIKIVLEDKGLHVKGRQQDLEHAVLNLIDNAVKYTKHNSTVTIGLKRSNDQAILYVKDQGPGIPKEAQERIFERFYRIDKNRSRSMGGTGLGLAIVKQVAKDHGGKVWVESTLGKGACFYMALPLYLGP